MEILAEIIPAALSAAPRAIIALVILVVGRWVSVRAGKAAETGFMKAPNSDVSLARFLASLLRYVLLFVFIMAALKMVGLDVSGLGGMMAGFGVAMAFILKDSLADIAAGVMLMLFKPFTQGDEVEIGGTKGVVTNIGLTATRMKTRNNIELIVQNSKAWGGVVKNYTAFGKRRLDMQFGVSYDADLDVAIEALKSAAAADERVYKDPAPWAKVISLGDSGVNIELRMWSDYNDMRAIKVEIAQPVKAALERAGVSIPYPHQVISQK